MKKLIPAIVIFSFLCYVNAGAQTNKKETKIKPGMAWEEAEKILKTYRANEAFLDVAAPRSPYGGYMTLRSYEIAKNTDLIIIYDNGVIMMMNICYDMDKPKAFRDWIEIKWIDLSNMATSMIHREENVRDIVTK